MALAWKFLNALDKEKVDGLSESAQNIQKNHDKLNEMKSVDLSDEAEKALTDLIKKHQKALDSAMKTVAEFDKELETFMKGLES